MLRCVCRAGKTWGNGVTERVSCDSHAGEMQTFIDPGLLDRLRVGPLASHFDAYLKHIEHEGSRSGRFKLCFGEDFLRWPRLPRFISGASTPQQMNTRRGCIENRRCRRGHYTAKAARTHALTASQSCALRWPITLNSER